jgi:hypothetical protein
MPVRTGTLAAIVLLLAVSVTAAGAVITAYPGSVVTLAGTSTGSDTVYLFATGPNLPADGGRLESPDTPVRSGDAGSFTTAAVGAGDRWTYRWRTGDAGLGPGTYTVYVVDAPADRSNLSGHAYTTISVTLSIPPDTQATGVATPTPMPPTAPAATAAAPSPVPTAAAPAAAIFSAAVAMLVAALLARR